MLEITVDYRCLLSNQAAVFSFNMTLLCIKGNKYILQVNLVEGMGKISGIRYFTLRFALAKGRSIN